MFKDIDRIFCINLITSNERKKEFTQRFPDLVNSDIFEWYITERDIDNPKRGCHNSHKNILELAKKRNYLKIIIFEDDANLLVPWEKFINTVNNIKYPDDWKAVQLGYLPFTSSYVKDNDTVIQINCSLATHCYIVNVEKLEIQEYISGKEVDRILFCPDYRNYLLNSPASGFYGIFPNMLVKQNGGDSTISNGRNLQGSLYYDRDTLLKVSLMCNYSLLSAIIFILLVVFMIIAIIYYAH